MATVKYSVITEPWMDVINGKGEVESVGLMELFRRAHEFTDFAPVMLHGITLSLYQYLPLRLACGIFTDAYRKKVKSGTGTADILSKGSFDFSKDGCIPVYFGKYGERFDLFDEMHPFLQTGKEDIEVWKSLGANPEGEPEDIMSVNPCAPAATARISEASGIDPDEFRKHIKNTYRGRLYSAVPDKIRSSDLMKAVTESYAITPKEWVYIVMYHSCVFSGVGKGNKNALAGNASYAEIIQGKNLFETIILNSLFMMKKEISTPGTPQWRWNSQTDIYFDDVRMSVLSGLFCPSKVLVGKPGENGTVTDIVKSYLSFGKRGNDLMDEMRQQWAKDFEPHFVVNLEDSLPVKKGKKGKPDVRDLSVNMYRVLHPGTEIWLLPAGATQTDTTRISDDDLKYSAKASRNTRAVAGECEKGNMIHIRNYYRVCNAKWVYLTSGVVDGVFPSDIFMDDKSQHLVRSAVRLVRETGEKTEKNLRLCLRPNLREEPGKDNIYPAGELHADTALTGRMERYFGLDGSRDGFLYRASVADSDEERTKLWKETVKAVRDGVREVFSTNFRPNRIMELCRYEDMTIGFINKKGEELYG